MYVVLYGDLFYVCIAVFSYPVKSFTSFVHIKIVRHYVTVIKTNNKQFYNIVRTQGTLEESHIRQNI